MQDISYDYFVRIDGETVTYETEYNLLWLIRWSAKWYKKFDSMRSAIIFAEKEKSRHPHKKAEVVCQPYDMEGYHFIHKLFGEMALNYEFGRQSLANDSN